LTRFDLDAIDIELLAQSRVEPAYFVVARRGKSASALLHSTAARDFPMLAAIAQTANTDEFDARRRSA
jgi:hypothetical protein